MIVKYVNSNNDSHSFFGKNIKACNGTFHKRKWSFENGRAFKNAISYTITLTLRGTLDERKQKLNELFELFEYDLENNTQGTIYVDDYQIACNVVSSEEKINSSNNQWTDVDIEIYCESANWVKKTNYTLDNSQKVRKAYGSKRYAYTYPYIYNAQKDIVNIVNGSVAKADVVIRLFGACVNPFVKIGKTVYQINASLDNGEYFEIDTENRTIYKITPFGEKINAFMYRDKSRDNFFEKIDKGVLIASKGGSYVAEITVIEKRSEPKWK